MSERYTFDRLELAGALGDLGTLLPIAIAMVLFNGLNALGLFLSIGVFYVVSGLYFGITVPVQPMKVIGAYAIATAMSAEQIMASVLLMGVFLLIVGLTGVMIGALFMILALLLGDNIVGLFSLLPMSILGVLLVFAGSQLTLTIMDLDQRKDYFVATLILGITLASNLAAGFIIGMIVAQLLRWEKLSV